MSTERRQSSQLQTKETKRMVSVCVCMGDDGQEKGDAAGGAEEEKSGAGGAEGERSPPHVKMNRHEGEAALAPRTIFAPIAWSRRL